mmetsp:Transcript_2915/g.4951  ORF Transcript_2915/g.4951 Transcript_2915/m.4951 type:complete len:88 (+) Transcript_2915:202-465(+)
MCERDTEQRRAFTFLEDVRQRFLDTYTSKDIEIAKSYSLKSFGSEVLKPRLQLYNENPELGNDKSDKLLKNMLVLKDSMVENIDKLI